MTNHGYVHRERMQILYGRLNYEFKDRKLITAALTHSSYANEVKEKIDFNERLEFLGDSVLSLTVSEYIYKTYPRLPEGSLTKLRAGVVSEFSLAKAARSIYLGEFLLLGKGEENNGGRNRDSILADALEAVIGAIYLDGGPDSSRAFVLSLLSDAIKELSAGNSHWDSKTILQELLQSRSTAEIKYEIIGEKGPDHNKSFTAKVSNNGKAIGQGIGKSKKEAEQNAAHNALENLHE